MADEGRNALTSRQIADELLARIAAGELKPGDKMPTVRELMAQTGASINTVGRALRELKDRGLTQRDGRNSIVRKPVEVVERSAEYTKPRADDQDALYQDRTRLTEVGPTGAPDYVARLLGIEEGDAVIVRRRTMIRNEVDPVELVTSYFPIHIASGTELAGRGGLSKGSPTALARLGFPPESSTEWVSCRLPTPDEAEKLRLAATAPVLRLLRQLRMADGTPVEVTEMVMPGEGNVLRYEL